MVIKLQHRLLFTLPFRGFADCQKEVIEGNDTLKEVFAGFHGICRKKTGRSFNCLLKRPVLSVLFVPAPPLGGDVPQEKEPDVMPKNCPIFLERAASGWAFHS